MRNASLSLGAALLVGLLAAPADAGEPGWRVRGFGSVLAPDTDETTVNGDGDDILISADRGFGGGASVEYQFNRFLGVDAGIVGASPELALSADIPELGPLSVADTLTTVVDRCLSIAGATRGLLLLRDDSSEWSVRVARGPGCEDLAPEGRAFARSLSCERFTNSMTAE